MNTPSSAPVERSWETAADVARRVQVGIDWVWQETRSGHLKGRKVGRSYRYDPADVDAWVEGRR